MSAAAGGTIRAGRAAIEAFIDDRRLRRDVAGLAARMTTLGAAIGRIGIGMVAAAAGVLTPMAAAAAMFARAGDNLAKMSDRTGVAARSLAELEFAAGQSDASLRDVGSALSSMARMMLQADEESRRAVRTLEALGVSMEELKRLSPEDRFMRMADAIAAIRDPTQRAALATRVFGSAGEALLPMLGNIRALRQEYRQMAPPFSDADAALASRLSDAWGLLRMQFRRIREVVGAAVAPAITDLLGRVSQALAIAGRWVDENRVAIATLARLAVVVGAAGITLIGVGIGMKLLAVTTVLAAKGWYMLTGVLTGFALPAMIATVKNVGHLAGGLKVIPMLAIGAAKGLMAIVPVFAVWKRVPLIVAAVGHSLMTLWKVAGMTFINLSVLSAGMMALLPAGKLSAVFGYLSVSLANVAFGMASLHVIIPSVIAAVKGYVVSINLASVVTHVLAYSFVALKAAAFVALAGIAAAGAGVAMLTGLMVAMVKGFSVGKVAFIALGLAFHYTAMASIALGKAWIALGTAWTAVKGAVTVAIAAIKSLTLAKIASAAVTGLLIGAWLSLLGVMAAVAGISVAITKIVALAKVALVATKAFFTLTTALALLAKAKAALAVSSFALMTVLVAVKAVAIVAATSLAMFAMMLKALAMGGVAAISPMLALIGVGTALAVALGVLYSEGQLDPLIDGLKSAGKWAGGLLKRFAEWTGIAGYIGQVREEVGSLGSYLGGEFMSLFGKLKDIFFETFGGIQDAIAAGDWRAAGDVLMAGLGAAWTAGVNTMLGIWYSFRDSVIEAFAGVVMSVHRMWTGMVQKIANSLIDMASQDGVAGAAARKVLGFDPRKQDADTLRMQTTGLEVRLEEQERQRAEAVAGGADAATIAEWDQMIERTKELLADPRKFIGDDTATDDMKRFVGDIMDDARAAVEQRALGWMATPQDRADRQQAADAREQQSRDRLQETRENAAENRRERELEEQTRRYAEQFEEAMNAFAHTVADPEGAGTRRMAAGTFSGARLGAQLAGFDIEVDRQQLNAMNESNEHLEEIEKQMQELEAQTEQLDRINRVLSRPLQFLVGR